MADQRPIFNNNFGTNKVRHSQGQEWSPKLETVREMKTNRLWTTVPPKTASQRATTEVAPGVRPTVTTLLRHNRVVEEREKATKSKIEGIVQGKTDFDFEAWRFRKSLEERKAAEAQEAKRILKAKLAYHKAIHAAKQVQNIKSEQANSLRYEAQKMRHELSQEREAEMERRRNLASEIQENIQNCRKNVEGVFTERRRQANEFKEQTAKLRQEARRKEFEELITKKEKIQKIQASKLALRAVNAHPVGSAAGFISAIGSPDTEIRLKLSKEKEQAELEEKRQRVRSLKQQQIQKMNKLKQKLETHVNRSVAKRQLKEPFKNLPEYGQNLNSLKDGDGELSQLVTELKRFTGNKSKSSTNLNSQSNIVENNNNNTFLSRSKLMNVKYI